MSELNARQKMFTVEYIKDKNATQAAIRAGYSKKTAYSIGQRLLKKVEIKQTIDNELKRIRMNNISEATEVEEFFSLVMKGEIQEEVIFPDGMGGIVSSNKPPSIKDRLRAAENLSKRYGLDKPVEKEIDTGGVVFEFKR